MDDFFITVIPRLSTLSDDHSSSRDASSELVALLSETRAVAFQAPPTKIAEGKGSLQDIVVNVGGSGVTAGFVLQVLKLWLHRDRRRSLVFRRTLENGSTVEVEVKGDSISDETLRKAIESIK